MRRFDIGSYSVKFLFLFSALFSSSFSSFAQSDSVLRVSLILAFQTESTGEKLNDYLSAHDVYSANRIRLNEDAQISLDFYEGALQSLNEYSGHYKIEWSVYDCWNDDSITELILQKPEMKMQDIIIGSVSTSTAKLVAAFCKENKILNIQPFTPSKSLTSDNPYHIKIAPTIDSHVDAMFNAILDSFAGANIIIYTPDIENSVSIADQFDSLFRTYNQTALKRFKVTLLNAGNMMLNGKKTTAAEQLVSNHLNILILTSFEESFVNGSLRTLYEYRAKYPMIVYGMPTWLSGDILRLDYLNDFTTQITDVFALDTIRPRTKKFIENYQMNFSHEPSKYSVLGYDVLNFTLESMEEYGKEFPEMVYTQVYSGCGYKIELVKIKNKDQQVNYFENRHVNIFRVEDYRLRKVW
ncbi:MAG: amino acid ABC transporter substrate-binding protein [Bacteroidetes bacterium]|nr:amino acid ABC transporter substrate-binding protein [Bacteroidota bacterium]